MTNKSISFQYKNRRGDVYYLYQGVTKKGNPKYFFSMKTKANPLASIPDGFEVYENPNTQVFLVKKEPPLITDQEKQTIINAMNNNHEVEYFFVDVRKKYITIYIAEKDNIMSEEYSWLSKFNPKANLLRLLHYEAQMRFELIDGKQRYFVAERFCYRGSIDDWITIGSYNALDNLVEKFVRHLGKETFYELFPV